MTVTATPKLPSSRGGRPHNEKPKEEANKVRGQVKADKARTEAVADRRARRVQTISEAVAIVQIPLMGIAAADQARLDDGEVSDFALDILTIDAHRKPFAEAVCELADTHPVIGVLLDRFAVATPFAALASVVVSCATQIAENHRKLPERMRGLSPNLVPRDDYVAVNFPAMDNGNGRKVRDNSQA